MRSPKLGVLRRKREYLTTQVARHREVLTLAWPVEVTEDRDRRHEVLHVHRETHSVTTTTLTETNEEVETIEDTVESVRTLPNVVHNFLNLPTETDLQSRG